MAVDRTNVTLQIPTLEELWFRQRMLEDLETMAYNHAWGGTIPWPREEWKSWFEYWIEHPERKRFYRYLKDEETGIFVGEIAYHWDDAEQLCVADVIVFAPYRGRGFGRSACVCCVRRPEKAGLRCSMTILRRTIRPSICSSARDLW